MVDAERLTKQGWWKNYDIDNLTIKTSKVEKFCPLDKGRLTLDSLPPRMPPPTDSLSVFAPEILHLILSNLDIRTLTILRCTNTSIRNLISTHTFYNDLITASPNTLRALLSTGTASSISLSNFHANLISPNCAICGDSFGDFFHLLLFTRICHACLSSSSTARPIEVSTAKVQYGLSRTTILHLPKLISLPGAYSRGRDTMIKRIQLCLPATAHGAGVLQHGSKTRMYAYVQQEKAKLEAKMRKKVRGMEGNIRGEEVVMVSTPSAQVEDTKWDNPLRHMVVVRFPWLDKRKRRVEWGTPCVRCRENAKDFEDGERLWNVRYSEGGLLEHLETCRGL
jgi:hypothetical protein